MSRRFKDVEEHVSKPDIAAVLDHYGVRYNASRLGNQQVSCPLHDDKTPSCRVSLSKQVWFCHSCGEHGDSLDLIQRMEGVDFAGARDLAASLGIAERDAGGGTEAVRGSSYGGRRTLASRKGSDSSHNRYVPPWRRG